MELPADFLSLGRGFVSIHHAGSDRAIAPSGLYTGPVGY